MELSVDIPAMSTVLGKVTLVTTRLETVALDVTQDILEKIALQVEQLIKKKTTNKKEAVKVKC